MTYEMCAKQRQGLCNQLTVSLRKKRLMRGEMAATRYRQVAAEKQRALVERYAQTPERFTAGRPTVPLPPQRVLINPISPADLEAGATDKVNFPTLSRVVEARAKK
jgi:hypothetical protein